MKNFLRRGQSGYLLEVPIILMATFIFLSIVLPKLPSWAAKILVVPGAVVMILCLHYMIMTPGWQPGGRPLRYPLNLILFSLISCAIIARVAIFLFS